ncbi:Spermatogenesis-defective protein 39-like protein [Camelus dromedarius]|uniref:NADP-dependent oxidoreductase domain-containing protein 1 n=1 Tax=Camelus dromedarius TaxID=9838 RepID=A0A5N4E2U6_CAMDR|nr:Spermatogenesis-defective protein 39-like protein [Camelus dromedarius]
MNRTKGDEEEYWNSSKFKAFTFDDEDDELSQLKESKRAVNSLRDFVDDDDDDDLERVSWSGEPVGRRTRPGSFQSLSDALSDTPAKSYAPELGRPKGEYRDYSNDWSPSDTVRRLRKGKVCSLERFRSLQDKLQLLEEAVSMHDGNVITAVLIFLKRTLSKEILFRELEVRQVALRHLIHFLKEIGDQKLLLDLFRFLDRTEELALSHYREHLNIQDPDKRKEFLKTCIGLPFSAEDSAHIQDHYTLLERQIIIEANDRHLESAGQTEIFRKHPRKASILNMPLVTTLFYSCFYHYTEAEGTFSSPVNLKKTFKIPDKQYVLTALAARAKLRAWHDVDALFTTKNWLGYTKKRAPVGFHRVVEILHKNSAPVQDFIPPFRALGFMRLEIVNQKYFFPQILQEYVNLVEDVDTKLNLATKFKCHDVVIDTYRDLKDRQQLLAYRSKVDKGSAEEEKIDAILNSSVSTAAHPFSTLTNSMEELNGISHSETSLPFLPVKVESALLWESYSISSLGPNIRDAGLEMDMLEDLNSLQFEYGIQEEDRSWLYLLGRSHGLMIKACAHAAFFCKLLRNLRESFSKKSSQEKKISEDIPDDDELKVGIIGGGHLGKQLAHTLLQLVPIPAESLRISTRRPEALGEFKKLGIQCFYRNSSLVQWANVIFLCCLPSQLPNICVEIQTSLEKACIVYSFVAAIPIPRLKHLLNHTNILRPQYQCVEDLDNIWGANKEITAALQDPVILQATCPYSPAGGIILNVKWLEGVFYAAINTCTRKDMSHSQVLQLLNELFLSVHFETCGKDGASCRKFQVQDFVSKAYAENLSQKR